MLESIEVVHQPDIKYEVADLLRPRDILFQESVGP